MSTCRLYAAAAVLLLQAVLCGPLAAQERAGAQDLLALGAGWYDLFKWENQAADFRLEYRVDQMPQWLLKPWAGLEVTSDSAVYGLGGLLIDLAVSERSHFTSSIGAGAYSNGDGKDMGNTLQFRVQGEVAYRFEDGSRLALALSHISNARTASSNPGAEVLSVYYLLPIDSLFR